MLQIFLDEYPNGFSLDIYDPDSKLHVRELAETKLDALNKMQRELDKIIQTECKKRSQVFNRR